MKRLIICLLLSAFCLLLIAARPRPRPCGTRTQCFNQLFPLATMTLTPILTPTRIEIPQLMSSCPILAFLVTGETYILPCQIETATAFSEIITGPRMATWTPFYPVLTPEYHQTLTPSAYPPPAGYP